jgi:hypothetical protein
VYPHGATQKNYHGEDVKIPPGHIMSPRDEAMDAIPLIRRGGADPQGFSKAERKGFLAGNDGVTNTTPHHRHQIPVRDGGVLDELPSPGHRELNQHTSGSLSRHPNDGKGGRNPSIFSGPAGEKLHRDEVKQFWIAKGKRLVWDDQLNLYVDPEATYMKYVNPAHVKLPKGVKP